MATAPRRPEILQIQQFAQKAFVKREDDLLLVRKSLADPHNPGRWEAPGGRMNFGEDVDAHLIREVKEETGVAIVPGPPFHIWQWVMSDIRPGSDREIQVVAVARACAASTSDVTAQGQEATDFIDEIAWVPVKDLLGLDLIPSLRPAAEAYTKQFC